MGVSGNRQYLTTLYVVPEHRGRGLAKVVASKIVHDLHSGLAGEGRAQSDWCLAEVARENAERRGEGEENAIHSGQSWHGELRT